jgi:hypothetical protein
MLTPEQVEAIKRRRAAAEAAARAPQTPSPAPTSTELPPVANEAPQGPPRDQLAYWFTRETRAALLDLASMLAARGFEANEETTRAALTLAAMMLTDETIAVVSREAFVELAGEAYDFAAKIPQRERGAR